MRNFWALMGLLTITTGLSAADSIHDFTLDSIQGQPTSLSTYSGKLVLMVNVASKCGFTPQYEGLEALYRKYKDRGLVVLGFPANNFAGQEPGANEEILAFCKRTYDVTFPMFSKISVKGDDQAPLYRFLTDAAAHPETGGEIRWNFTKFLADDNGRVIARFESKVTPEQIDSAIAAALD